MEEIKNRQLQQLSGRRKKKNLKISNADGILIVLFREKKKRRISWKIQTILSIFAFYVI